ncbi:FtsX-like permease family protein [Glycomyces rhizosphaerae]|uniref:FtsX-like permease family protein n=1 Tax=Glycomyces rhizosphaerae TaxID=2054422 RepID=A0ABV7PZ36_9ACTN
MTVRYPWAASRLALRIARREAMRYKGRSALSIALLGLPLLGVAVAASAYDTMQLSPEEITRQHVGENDAYVEVASDGTPVSQYTWDARWPVYETEEAEAVAASEADLLAALPEGSHVAPYNPDTSGETQIDVETPDGLGTIRSLGYDLTDDAYEASGMAYLEGGIPSGDEVALSAAAADYLELGVGDDLVVDQDETTVTYKVSGIVEFPWDLNGQIAIGTVFPEPTNNGWLVDVPGAITHEHAMAVNEIGLTVWAPSFVNDPPPPPEGGSYQTSESSAVDTEMLTVYGLIAAVVVMEVVLLSGPAFAISAKRRTREFALMSANGATPAQIRGVVLAGGLLFGLIAAGLAVLLGIGVLAAGLPALERFVGHRSAGIQIMPWIQAVLAGVAIGTGLLSALAAAVSASRINVVAALTGRTPSRKGTKRWMAIGLAAIGLGIAAGFVGVTAGSLLPMVAALVLTQMGLVACTPTLLGLTARLGRRLRLAPRMAMREAGRNRGSAAPAIAAVLGVVAGGIAFSMTVTANAVRNEENQEHLLPQGAMTITLQHFKNQEETPDWEGALEETRRMLSARLDDVELTAVTRYSGWEGCGFEAGEGETVECLWTPVRPDENACPYWSADTSTPEAEAAAVEAAREDERCDERADAVGIADGTAPATTDPKVVAAYTDLEGAELDEAVAMLKGGGVLVADPWALTDQGTVVFRQEITTWNESGGSQIPQETYLELPAMVVDKGQLGHPQTFLSPAAAERMGYTEPTYDRLYLLETSTEVDTGDVEALAADFDREVAGGEIFAHFAITDYRDPFASVLVLGVTGLCALIALGATAVSTGLIIAEQRRDMTTLAAVGAAPGLRRRFAMWQIVVIAVFGTALGTAAGTIGYALIRSALNSSLQKQYPFHTLYGWELPWPSIGITLLAVPILAAIGALLFTRANLPSERRLT